MYIVILFITANPVLCYLLLIYCVRNCPLPCVLVCLFIVAAIGSEPNMLSLYVHWCNDKEEF